MTDKANPAVLAEVWEAMSAAAAFDDDPAARLVMLAIAAVVVEADETVYLTFAELAHRAGLSESVSKQAVRGSGARKKAKPRNGLAADGWLSVASRGRVIGGGERPLAFKLGHRITGDHTPADATIGITPTSTKKTVAPTETHNCANESVAPTLDNRVDRDCSISLRKKVRKKRQHTYSNSEVAPTDALAEVNGDYDEWQEEFEANRRASGAFEEDHADPSWQDQDHSAAFMAEVKNQLRELSYA